MAWLTPTLLIRTKALATNPQGAVLAVAADICRGGLEASGVIDFLLPRTRRHKRVSGVTLSGKGVAAAGTASGQRRAARKIAKCSVRGKRSAFEMPKGSGSPIVASVATE